MASILSAGTTSATAMVHTADTSGVLQLASNNGVVAVTVDTAQNVGIGTASPNIVGSYKTLDIRGTGGGLLNLGTNSNACGYIFNDGTNMGVSNNQNGVLNFYTNALSRVTVSSVGDLAIGSTVDAGNTLRYLDVYNTNTGATAGAILRLITSNSAGSGNTTVDMVKYKTGAFSISNNEPSSASIQFNLASLLKMQLSQVGVLSINTNVGNPTIDTSAISTAYATSATQDFPNMSGIIVANSATSGYSTIWICGGGSSTAIANANGGLNNGTLAYVAGISGYRWTNTWGAANTTQFFVIRTRAAG
jgi:hypothetical protein